MRAIKYELTVTRPHRDLMALEEVAARFDIHPEILRRFIQRRTHKGMRMVEKSQRDASLIQKGTQKSRFHPIQRPIAGRLKSAK